MLIRAVVFSLEEKKFNIVFFTVFSKCLKLVSKLIKLVELVELIELMYF